MHASLQYERYSEEHICERFLALSSPSDDVNSGSAVQLPESVYAGTGEALSDVSHESLTDMLLARYRHVVIVLQQVTKG